MTGTWQGLRLSRQACLAMTCAALACVDGLRAQQWIVREARRLRVVSAVFDSGRQRLVLLTDEDGKAFGTWEWDGRSWARRALPASPPYRSDFGLAYDEHRRRAVLFGGHTPLGEFSDTWEYDGFGWQLRAPPASPPGRHEHGFAYEPRRRRTVLFGGFGQGPRDDTWEWDGTTWTQVAAATRPSPRVLPGLTWDPTRGAMLMFGGFDARTLIALSDTWAWDGTNWTHLNPPASPQARLAPAMGADVGRRRVVLYGGWPAQGSAHQDTWEWDGTSWLRHLTGPTLRDRLLYPRLLYVPSRGRLMFVGGSQLWNDLWQWDGSLWTYAASIPEGNDGAWSPIAYDAGRERMVQAARGRTFEWDGVTWEARVPTSFHPTLSTAAMAYDVGRRVCVLFGPHWLLPTAIYEWDGVVWRELRPSVQPSLSAGLDGALAYDVARRRTLFFGGRSAQGPLLGETWEWDGTTWSRRQVASGPTPRGGHAMAYDVARERVVLFGGFVEPQPWWPGMPVDDTWEWNGSRWIALQPTTRPQARAGHSMAYDAVRRRIVLHGGTLQSDTWVFDGSTWSRLNVQPAEPLGGAMAYDLARQRMVMVGSPGRTWLLGPAIAAAATTHGTACGPGGGPRLEPLGLPWLGNAGFGSDLYRARPLAPALLALSLGEVDLQLGGGCKLHIDPGQVGLVAVAATDVDGFAHVRLGVPSLPQLTGLRLFGQSIVLDPQGPWLGLSLTQGMRLVIGD